MVKRLSFSLAALAVCFALASPSLAGKGGGKPAPDPEPPADPAIAYTTIGRQEGLWVMNLDGSNKTEIFSGHARVPSFSPDGSEVAFQSDAVGSGLYVVGVDGSGLRQVAPKTGAYLGGGTSWSAHGWIAFTDDESGTSTPADIFIVRPDGTGLLNLTSTTGRAEYDPTWNAAGDKLAVTAYTVPPVQGEDPPVIVYSVEIIDGVPTITEETNVTDVAGSPFEAGSGASVANPNFARNSDRLAVQAILPGETVRSLWILDLADPANPRRLTSPDKDEIVPTWCDDDSRIVFNGSYRSTSVLWSIDVATGSDVQRLGDKFQGDHACRP